MLKSFSRKLLILMTSNMILRKMFALLPFRNKEYLKKVIKTFVASSKKRASVQRRSDFKRSSDRSYLISVVLPVFNHDEYLCKAIESVLNQSYSHLELIIVDDGSQNVLFDRVKSYLDDPRVKYIRQVHGGLPKALNTGFFYATGDYLTWTSADNIMGETNLEELLSTLIESKDKVMVYADYAIIDEGGNRLRESQFRLHNQHEDDNSIIHLPEDANIISRIHDNFIGPNFMYRRLMTTIGYYDDSIGVEDYDYWVRGLTFFSFVHFAYPYHLYLYRVHGDSLSAKASELRISEKAKFLLKRAHERKEYLRKNVTIAIDETTTTFNEKLKNGLIKWCKLVTPSLGSSRTTILIVDFDKRIKTNTRSYESTIVIVKRNETEFFTEMDRQDDQLIFLAIDYNDYIRLKRLGLKSFHVESECNLAGAISSIASSLRFETKPEIAPIEMIKVKSLQIFTDWINEDTDLLNDLSKFGHHLSKEYEKCDVGISNQPHNFMLIRSDFPIIYIVDNYKFIEQLHNWKGIDKFICSKIEFMGHLEKRGVSPKSIYLMKMELSQNALREVETILISAVAEGYCR